MSRIRIDMEIPLSVELMPRNTFMHGSLNHLLPEDRNRSNFVFVKQESEFLNDMLHSESVRNIAKHLRVSSMDEEKHVERRIGFSDIAVTSYQMRSSNEPPKESPLVSERLYDKGRIDVVKMSVEMISDYKYFFIYEDQRSKFVVLKALHTDTAKEVAIKLLEVLAIIGAPRVLQSGNGRNFAEQVVHELRSLWDDIFILHGDASKSEVSCKYFKNSLESWMMKNPTKTWHEGLNFIQILHNVTYRCQNDMIPCDVLFGRNVRENFRSLDMKSDMETLWAEEELIEHLSNKNDRDMLIEDSRITSNSADRNDENNDAHDATSRDESSKNNYLNDYSFIDMKNETFAGDTRTTDLICADNVRVKNKSKTNGNVEFLKCKYCQKQYMKPGHLKNHMKTHKAGRVLRCELCDKTFGVLRLYGKHMKQSHGRDNSLEEKDRVGRRNTRSNANNVTASNERKEDLRITNEIIVSDTMNDKNETVGNVRDRPIVQSSNLADKRKSTMESRVSRIRCTLQCTYCKQKFSFPSVLKRHMRSHTNERPYVCQICDKSFKQLGHLSQHSLTHHDYRSFRCTVCGVKLDSLDTLKQHTHSHRSNTVIALKMRDVYRLFECDSCKKVFTTKSVLERHIFTHTQERQFDCKVCGKRFKQAGHVKSHMLVHTGERRYQCNLCPKRFSLSNSLKKHMYVHNGEKPYQCDVCGARFLEKRNLNGHLLTHTNERPYCCKICGKRYTLADTLRRHVSAAHEDGRTYQCEICAKMFKQLAHLSVHKKVHNDERPFQCHLCEKNFKHKNVLKSHLAIHANVRPFECDICKATFVRKTNLQTHISSAHMNERPYVCTICGKRFKQVSHLNGHVVVHSNLMPYKCDYCDRRCNRLDNLKKHMRLHTKNKE